MTVPVVDIAVGTRSESAGYSCVFETVILKYGIPLLEQITQSDTKYVVKWNFDLKGDTLTMPRNCMLDFDGGRISNGSIVWSDTKVHNLWRYDILQNIRESGVRTTLGGDD